MSASALPVRWGKLNRKFILLLMLAICRSVCMHSLTGTNCCYYVGYIGYMAQISELIAGEIKDDDDDQLYFTKQFLDEEKRVSS
jgi:hypothetical protein